MNSISTLSSAASFHSGPVVGKTPDRVAQNDSELRSALQGFVAGTFYKQMLKALRQGQQTPAYFHGGAAEEMFQNQMDQFVAEDIADGHGHAISDPLFDAFVRQLRTSHRPTPRNSTT